MSENGEFALVPRLPSAVEKAVPGAKHILSGMVTETLALVKRDQRTLAQATFRIGSTDWCEPDYRQILLWAKATRLKPEEILACLYSYKNICTDSEDGQMNLFPVFDEPWITEGRLRKVNWNFGLLPCSDFDWADGLELTHARFFSTASESRLNESGPSPSLLKSQPLSRLIELHCRGLGLTELDLSKIPSLRWLKCNQNRLQELMLDAVPELTSLRCDTNQIEELDFRRTPRLASLDCSDNNLSSLELSGLTQLTQVSCRRNQLSDLRLHHLPSLCKLDCAGNWLRDLILVQVPGIEELNCSDNDLYRLDLSRCRELVSLDCSDNRLTELDVSSCGDISELICPQNRLTSLDIRNLRNLETLAYDEERTRLIQRPDQEFGL